MKLMNAVFCFSIFATSQSSPTDLGHFTYSEAAEHLILPAFQELVPQLTPITKDTLPHEVKKPVDLRKEILKVRDYLDIFAFALPHDSINGKDAYKKLRDDLDVGYEIMGQFKDLFDVQAVNSSQAKYDRKELQERRQKLFTWLERFLKRTANYEAYLLQMNGKTIVDRDSDSLSDFYWGTTDLKPSRHLSAKDNLRLLLKDVLVKAILDWPQVRKIKNPAKDPHNIEVFHDFRKRVRTLVKVTNYFPELIPWTSHDIQLLQDITKHYGVISDQVAKLILAENAGKNSKIKDLEEDTKELWKKLQKWENDHNIGTKLTELRSYF